MIRIAIVEDNETDAKRLSSCIAAWCVREEKEMMNCTVYSDAVKFLEQGASTADIVFMDIEMPHMNGMDAAAEFRKFNQDAVLVFFTRATKYAVRGYAVDAIGYLVKPIAEKAFSEVFEKALRLHQKRNQNQTVVLRTKNGVVKVSADQIQYIEAEAHQLHVYTENGVHHIWSGMNEMMEILPEDFVRCHKGYIVNMKHIYSVQKDRVTILGRTEALVPVSRPKRAEFMQQVMRYYAQTIRG